MFIVEVRDHIIENLEAAMRRHIEEPGEWIQDAVNAQPPEAAESALSPADADPVERNTKAV